MYLRGISFDRTQGIAKVPLSQSLEDDAIRNTLYQEVLAHFNALPYTFRSGLST